jgi:hypothetical protein
MAFLLQMNMFEMISRAKPIPMADDCVPADFLPAELGHHL